MKPIFRKSLVAAATAMLFAAPFSANATNGYFGHGYGTANKGLAGGGVALPQDAMIAATNPAGMVFVGDRIDAGAALFSPSDRSYEAGSSVTGVPDGAFCGNACPFTIGGAGGNQSITSSNDFFLIPSFGYNKMLDADSSIGVSVYGNGGMNTLYKGGQAQHNNGLGTAVTTPGTFGAGSAGIDLVQLFLTTTYSRKINSKASWGASLILAGQRFRAKGLGTFAGFSSDPSKLSSNKHDYSYGVGGKFGVMGEVTPGVTLAASYQTKISMGEFDDYAGLFAEKGDFDIPPTATVGVAWETAPNSVLTFDVQYIWYGDIAAISNPVQGLFTCQPGPTGGTGSTCLGGSNGAGFGWEDMTIFKVGYQWQSSPEWTWRVGYSYGEQPIPSDQTMFNILAPATVESAITFGFTKKMSPTNDLSLAVMYAPNTDVTGANPFDPTQQIKIEMEQYEVEASWSWKF
ncbi:MAG TPA: hypothetical protein ENI64_00250 [Gammaproteobacteria bacterium]|nr:hypothetical protein [Gammaproteobacteria bacterium]